MFGFFIYDNMVFFSKAKVIGFNADEASKRGGILWFFANIAGFILAINNLNAVGLLPTSVRHCGSTFWLT